MNENLQKKLAGYQVPETVKDLIRNTNITLIVGVTAAGKDTVGRKLLTTGKYHRIVSHTTRPPRFNHGELEQDGVDYHFIDLATLETMLDNKGFVEAKYFSGNVYGTSVAEIQLAHDEGKIAITDMEVQGVAEYKAFADNVVAVFLLPPDFKTWQDRIKKRYDGDQIDVEDMKKRMQTAIVELKEALEKPYFEYVINQDLGTTVKIVDDLAHGQFSARKNAEAKAVAKHLLQELEVHSR